MAPSQGQTADRFVGKYIEDRSENFEPFMRAVGCPPNYIEASKKEKTQFEIVKDGIGYTFIRSNKFRVVRNRWVLNQQVEVETFKGRKTPITAKMEGQKMVAVSPVAGSQGRLTEYMASLELVANGQLKEMISCNGQSITRYYNRVVAPPRDSSTLDMRATLKEDESTSGVDVGIPGKDGRAKRQDRPTSGQDGRTSRQDGRTSGQDGRTSGQDGRSTPQDSRTSGQDMRATRQDGRTSGQDGRTSGQGMRATRQDGQTSGQDMRATRQDGRTSGQDGRTSGQGMRATRQDGRTSGQSEKLQTVRKAGSKTSTSSSKDGKRSR